MNTFERSLRMLLVGLPLLANASTREVTGWIGPEPLSQLPSSSLHEQSRQACLLSKSGQSPLLQESRDAFSDYDALYYEIDIEVFQGEDFLQGETRMHFSPLTEELLSFSLNAGENMTVQAVRLDGQDVPWTHIDDELLIEPLAPLSAGQVYVLAADFLANYEGEGVLSVWRTNVQTGQSVHTITTQSEPYDARHWWICKDDTRDKADSMRIAVTTNDFNTVVCNGVLEADTDNGDGTRSTTWFERWPMVTYLLSLCVTEYNHLESTWNYGDVSMPMHDWSWGLNTGTQQDVLNTGIFALDALSDRFGLYPFHDEKYGHAQYTWGGAMEHQTCSSMGFYSESVIAHELGHQWFGDKITCDTFHHIWLNEGWATYSEALYFEHYMGQEALHEYMTYEEYYGGGTIYVENPYTDVIFDGNLSYSKASWVLHMLRHVMGDEVFWEAVDDYLGPNEREYHRTADTDQFREFMEAHHGDDLGWFFEEWIFGERSPSYQYHWTAEDTGTDWSMTLSVIQSQVPTHQTFTMPLDLLIHYGDGSEETRVIWNHLPAEQYSLSLPMEPVSVELDPDHWVLSAVEELSSPPASNLIVAGAELRNTAGEEMDRIPDGEDFVISVIVSNTGGATGDVSLNLLSLRDEVVISNSPLSYESIAFGSSIEATFEGSAEAGSAGMASFLLSIDWEGADIEDGFAWPLGSPDMLLVDDDGGDTYEEWLINAADAIGGCDLATPESLPADLSVYSLIVWITGDNERQLSENEWQLFHDTVNAGGHWVFSGQNFAEAQGSTLLMEHLGMELVAPDYSGTAAQGTAGSIFANQFFFFFNGGAGNQHDMDVISSMVDCSTPLISYFSQPSGYAAEEFWCGDGGYIVMGFGLEGVSPTGTGTSLEEMLETLYDWSLGGTSLSDPAVVTRPAGIELHGAWPNPFNPVTTLHYTLPAAGDLRVRVYNLKGQQVDEWQLASQAAGNSELRWAPQGLASGLYLMELQLLQNSTESLAPVTQKVMLIK